MQKNAGFGIIKSIKLPHLSGFYFPFSGFKYIFVFPSVPVIITLKLSSSAFAVKQAGYF